MIDSYHLMVADQLINSAPTLLQLYSNSTLIATHPLLANVACSSIDAKIRIDVNVHASFIF